MPRPNKTRLIDQLDELKNQFAPGTARRIEDLIEKLSQQRLNDADSLFRYHEILLFLRAYPQNAAMVRATEGELRGFAKRVSVLRDRDVDLSPLQHPAVSGISGTSVIDTFSFHIVRWLLERYESEVEIDWEWFEDENRLAEIGTPFL